MWVIFTPYRDPQLQVGKKSNYLIQRLIFKGLTDSLKSWVSPICYPTRHTSSISPRIIKEESLAQCRPSGSVSCTSDHLLTSKHGALNMFNQCCIDVGPASTTLCQHQYNIGSESRARLITISCTAWPSGRMMFTHQRKHGKYFEHYKWLNIYNVSKISQIYKYKL